jgi:hypothetical protein
MPHFRVIAFLRRFVALKYFNRPIKNFYGCDSKQGVAPETIEYLNQAEKQQTFYQNDSLLRMVMLHGAVRDIADSGGAPEHLSSEACNLQST